MAALIEYVCTARHARRKGASVTWEHDSWAYCSSGGVEGHHWTRIEPTPVEALLSPAGDARRHLVADEAQEPEPSGLS